MGHCKAPRFRGTAKTVRTSGFFLSIYLNVHGHTNTLCVYTTLGGVFANCNWGLGPSGMESPTTEEVLRGAGDCHASRVRRRRA